MPRGRKPKQENVAPVLEEEKVAQPETFEDAILASGKESECAITKTKAKAIAEKLTGWGYGNVKDAQKELLVALLAETIYAPLEYTDSFNLGTWIKEVGKAHGIDMSDH